MISFFTKSLRNKILASFLGIGLLPFILLLGYTLLLSEKKIVDQAIHEQFNRADVIINLINSHLQTINKDVDFVASLDTMDDILADDIDKRISSLLNKKADDFNHDVDLFVVNKKMEIISSSNINLLLKKFQYSALVESQNGHFILGNNIYFYSQIKASFDATKNIGHLILRYNLNNLTTYLLHQDGRHTYLINNKTGIRIGDIVKLNFKISNKEDGIVTKEHQIVYKSGFKYLKNFYLVYAVDKALALKFLYDFIRFMAYISIIILILIIYVSLKYSKGIVKPIENLTKATKNITKNQDYSLQLPVNSEDEIATLTLSFNNMLETTSSALKNLEEENRLRLKRFVQLIGVFNTIIQTQSEDECIDISIKEIKKLTNRNDLEFNYKKDQESIDIYVTDFEKNEQVYFGSISLSLQHITDKNEKDFYHSIASMIALQLDRIGLISRTMAASKAKSAFISNMSHELRTPLNAIIGFSQFLIAYEELTEDQQDTVGNIESSAHYLLSMINEILDIAKIEAGKMEAHLESCNILEIVHNSYNMLKPLANEKDLAFDLIAEDIEIDEFTTDPKMFQQILVNLLSNAIKFTEEGFIKLEVYDDKESLYIKVTDSGIGISSEDISKLFSDFTQVENVMQKKHKGTGLGLSLSKKMAHILNGDVSLESKGVGYGTVSLLNLKI